MAGAAYHAPRITSARDWVHQELRHRVGERSLPGEAAFSDKWSGKIALANGAMGAASVLLTAGGILLLMRRRYSGVTLKSWAGIKIAATTLWLLTQAGYNKDLLGLVFRGTRSMAGDGSELAASSARTEAITLMGISALWLVALPFFVLFWLSRTEIRRQVRDWR